MSCNRIREREKEIKNVLWIHIERSISLPNPDRTTRSRIYWQHNRTVLGKHRISRTGIRMRICIGKKRRKTKSCTRTQTIWLSSTFGCLFCALSRFFFCSSIGYLVIRFVGVWEWRTINCFVHNEEMPQQRLQQERNKYLACLICYGVEQETFICGSSGANKRMTKEKIRCIFGQIDQMLRFFNSFELIVSFSL